MWLPNTSYSPEDDRLSLGALWYPGASSNPFDVRSGVLRHGPTSGTGPLQVTAGSGGLVSNIAPGQAVYQENHGGTPGAYIVTNDATTTVTHDPADTQPRIDVIYVKVDSTDEGDLTSNTQPLIQKGVPAASNPAVPAVPSGTLPLSNVTVRANATSFIAGDYADARPFTTTRGGSLLSAAAPTNPHDWQEWTDSGAKQQKAWIDGAWQTLSDPAMFSAWTAYTPITPGNAFTVGNGTFTGRFKVIGKTCYFSNSVTWGSTSSWAGGWLITLPFAAASLDNTFPAKLFDASATSGAAHYSGVAFLDGVGRIGITFGNASGYMSATVPIAIAVGDKLTVSGSYEIA